MKDKISVCCLCYNHDSYLYLAIESFFKQKGNFDIEIVIFDDHSTDKSRDIINEFENRYPNSMKVIFAEENIYSQGRTAFFDIINASSGKYLAFCEGDDYWIDDYKLQKQLDYLKSNQDLNLVFHPSLTLTELDGFVDKSYGNYGKFCSRHSFEDILSMSGGYMPMASIFARRSAFDKWLKTYPDFFSKNMWHSTIQILGSYKVGCGYLPEVMSIYRSMHPGSWTHNITTSAESGIRDYLAFVSRNRGLRQIIDVEFNHIFDRVLVKRSFKLSKSRLLKFKQKKDILRNIPFEFTLYHKVKMLTYMVVAEILKYVKR
ncbi:glycosyltransferase family 2 protein [Vibrio cincinnatiensis]|uniref:glycosyltransferase family 2 protein n=1 Tax=Vibrio cincinnatiensis TaxID=675 RepID=UPI001FA9D63B|nr:glycosyltransferase [Vibrio cincinnatiensis]